MSEPSDIKTIFYRDRTDCDENLRINRTVH